MESTRNLTFQAVMNAVQRIHPSNHTVDVRGAERRA